MIDRETAAQNRLLAALKPEDLQGRKIFVGNSLHGLVPAELV